MAKNSIGLSTHTIAVKDLANSADKPLLSDFDRGADLLALIETYLNKLKSQVSSDGARKKAFRVRDVIRDDKARYVKGIIESGEYGSNQDIVNTKTGAKSYRTKTDDALLVPFYFLFHLPKDKHKGILVLQTFRQHGVYGALAEWLNLCFKGGYENRFRLDHLQMSNTNLLNKILDNSRVKEISLIRHEWPDDIANSVGSNSNEQKGKLVVSITAGYRGSLGVRERIKKMFSGQLPPNQVVELDYIEPDAVSVKLEYNGKIRTITYSDNVDLRSLFDITDDVKLGADNFPEFDSIDSVAQKVLEDIALEYYEGNVR